jgi:hypothetical protein
LLAVSDIVTEGPLPEAIKADMSAWAGCVAGALDVEDYISEIEAAGFVDVELNRSFWDDAIIDATIDQLDPEQKNQLVELTQEGGSLVVEEGGDLKAIEAEGEGLTVFDAKRAIFSAKIKAWKP